MVFCQICFQDFENESILNTHLQTHLFVCNLCKNAFVDKFDFEIHKHNEKGEAQFQCELCDEWFKELKRLKDHIGDHIPTTTEMYQCKDCKQTFKFKKNAEKHSCWKCYACLKVYRNKTRFADHSCLSDNSKSRKFNCNFCEKSFTRKEHLQAHLRQHFEESNYRCRMCPKSFIRQDYLNYHMNYHK